MNNLSKSQEQQLDDQLSEFADRVLSDENMTEVREVMNQVELAELQKTILLMKSAAQTARTNEDAAARIRTRLLTEWKKNKQTERQLPKRFVWNWTLPRIALAGGFAVLIIFSAVTLLRSSPTTPLMGAADGLGIGSPLFILIGIIVIIFLLWHNNRN
jgi:hypothetical protein